MRNTKDSPGVLHVAGHLFLQRWYRRKPLLRAEPLHEPDRDQLLVEVTIEIKDEDLDREGVPAEGWPEADAGCAAIGLAVDVDAGGVDGIRGDQLVGGDPQVRRWKPKLSAALGAMLDGGADDVISTEQLGRGPNLAEQHEASNPGTADRLSASQHGRSDIDGEAVPETEPAQEGGIAASAVPEAVGLADDDPPELDATDQPLHECRCAQRRDLRRKGDHHQMVQAELIQQPRLFVERGEIRRAMIRIEHTPRMRFEGDHDAGDARRSGTGDERLQKGEVATMNAVKGSDGRVARADRFRCGKADADRRHPANTARGWIRRVASASPQASKSPSGPSKR